MNESSWNLVIPVLVIGLTLGGVWSVLWRRRRSRAARSDDRDRQLLLADLQAHQDSLYEQLREADPEEREALEVAAARNLMKIEQAGGGKSRPTERELDGDDGAERASPEAPTAASPPAARGSSGWLGFAGGVASAALIGMLVVWAQRDAQPRPDDGAAAPMQREEAHPDGPPLSDREREALEQLAQRIDSDPMDVMARKQYAVGLLSTGRFMPAFEQAEILLGSDPSDPDGLYVKGMVRMRMGQESEARSLLERVLVDYPDHVPALTALGVMALRTGGLPAAEEYWNRALEFSGGRNPEVERLMAAARERVGSAQGGEASPAGQPVPQTVAPAGPAYTLEIELASGVTAPPASVLFISLRGGDGGPPLAVKRVSLPRLPMTVVLTGADAMMGQALPEAGTVFVRLDVDGSASTRDEGEPTAEVAMRVGETARLALQ